MKKHYITYLIPILLILLVSSCQKEESEPTPPTNNNGGGTNLTSKTLYIAKGNVSLDTYFEMPALLVGTNIYECNYTQATDWSYTFETETNYYVEFTIGTNPNTTLVYAGDIKFDTQGNLVEISGNQLGNTGYMIQVQTCNPTVGDQLVLYQ
ncbi:MAG: hypothetical protein Crog4KO_24040 [Crocinitomicaceae bacterium]